MVIFDKQNERIVLRDGKYYLLTDVGHFAEEYVEIEVTKEDPEKVMEDVMYSLKLAQDYQNKKMGLV